MGCWSFFEPFHNPSQKRDLVRRGVNGECFKKEDRRSDFFASGGLILNVAHETKAFDVCIAFVLDTAQRGSRKRETDR